MMLWSNGMVGLRQHNGVNDVRVAMNVIRQAIVRLARKAQEARSQGG